MSLMLSPAASPLFSERELQTRIQQALAEKFTGQIQVGFLFGKMETILAIQGQVRQIYIRNHRAPDLQWERPIEQYGAGTLAIEPMPARALMFRQIVLENFSAIAPLDSSTRQLQTMFDVARTNTGPTLFHIQWKHAEAFGLVAGGHISIRRAVLLNPFETEDWEVIAEHIAAWKAEPCNVTIYRSDIKNPAWLEIHLNTLFEWYSQNILDYYEQLTGAVMVRAVLQGLTAAAESKGWAISTQNQQLRFASVFASAAEAGRTYKEALAVIMARIEPVIGSSLTKYILKQSIEPTAGVYKTIQEAFMLMEDPR